jgi:hypothetical protein
LKYPAVKAAKFAERKLISISILAGTASSVEGGGANTQIRRGAGKCLAMGQGSKIGRAHRR